MLHKDKLNNRKKNLRLFKKPEFENRGTALFSNLKKLTFPQFAEIIFNSSSEGKALHDVEQMANKIIEFTSQYQKTRQQVRLKHVLKTIGRPECQKGLMDILGITSTASFKIYADELIEQGMIKSVGLDNVRTKEVAQVYKLTASRLRTSSYYINCEDNDFNKTHYDSLVCQSLERDINDKLKGFEYLKKQAELIKNKPKTKLDKCIVAISEWKEDEISKLKMMEYLSYELEIAPKTPYNFDKFLRLIIKKGFLKEETDNFGNLIYKKSGDIIGLS